MSIFERVPAVESKPDQGLDHSASAAFAEARLSSPPAANTEDRNSSYMQAHTLQPLDIIADGQGTNIIKLPRGPVYREATFPDRVASPRDGGGLRRAPDPDAGHYGGLQASADTPNPPVRTLSESEMRRARERMQPIPGESQADLLWRLQKA